MTLGLAVLALAIEFAACALAATRHDAADRIVRAELGGQR